jgi:glutathione S-transferase
MMKLFYSPNACSLATHICLEEAGADYELVETNVRTGAQNTPEYLALNPKGKVPALATDRGTLTETPALLAYVAQTHPEAGLAPLADPFEFARMQGINDYIAGSLHVAFAHIFRGYRWADDEQAIKAMETKGPSVVSACFQLIQDTMLRGPWLMGDAYSTSDAYLYTLGRWTPRANVDLKAFSKLAEHAARVAERPAVQRALAQEGLS